jgi:hypothetical protein
MPEAFPPSRLILLVAGCLLIGIAPRLAASADAAAGKLVIQLAVYGDIANDKTVDVTRKVAEMVKDDNLWVIASSKTFGDPAPGAAKKLKVGYLIDGIYRSKIVNEGEALDISTRLVIRKAVYGDLKTGPSVDVTEEVAALVQKNSLSVHASNEMFGDPAQGKVKKLHVDYSFDGKEKSKTVSENATLTISGAGE